MKFEELLKKAIGKKIHLEYTDGHSGETYSANGVLKTVENEVLVLQGTINEIMINRSVCYIVSMEVF